MTPRTRLAIAFITACATATATYAVLRVAQYLLFTEPNPALILYSAHAGYFWRSWISAFFGATIGFAAWLAPTRGARSLPLGVVVATGLLTAQTIFVP